MKNQREQDLDGLACLGSAAYVFIIKISKIERSIHTFFVCEFDIVFSDLLTYNRTFVFVLFSCFIYFWVGGDSILFDDRTKSSKEFQTDF